MPKLFIFLLFLSVQSQAQPMPTGVDVIDSLSSKPEPISLRESGDEIPLLPDRMLATQRIFWGPNGLLRVMNMAPLTPEGRQKEIKVRRFMLISHQATGYVTLAGFLLQGILATKLTHASGAEYEQLYQWQRTTATITTIAYGTTALLSLTAPPKLVADRKRTGGIRLHQYLSIIHLTGFIATNVLASKAAQHSELRSYQPVAAFTTLAAFAPALLAVKF